MFMFSPFLVSAADNSKDLATELVHYGFIHEVSIRVIPHLPGMHHATAVPRPGDTLCL